MKSELTRLLLEQHAAGTTIDALPAALVPSGLEDAYKIQNELIAELGPVGAWKIGPMPEEGEPVCAPLPARFVHRTGTTLSRRGLHGLSVEVEIAFTLASDLPGNATLDEVQGAIGSVHVALELVSSRYTDRKNVPRMAAFADFQSSGGLVLGNARAFDAGMELAGEGLRLTMDGEDVATAQSGPSTSNALRALTWLASHSAARGLGLSKGTIVITGARIGPEIFAGATARGMSSSFGTVAVDMDNSVDPTR